MEEDIKNPRISVITKSIIHDIKNKIKDNPMNDFTQSNISKKDISLKINNEIQFDIQKDIPRLCALSDMTPVMKDGKPIIIEKSFIIMKCKENHINKILINELQDSKCFTCFGGTLFSRKIVKMLHKEFNISVHATLEQEIDVIKYIDVITKIELYCHQANSLDYITETDNLIIHVYKKPIKSTMIFLKNILIKYKKLAPLILAKYRKDTLPFSVSGASQYLDNNIADINDIIIIDDKYLLFENC